MAQVYAKIWSNITPRKCSFLAWRVFKYLLPTDDRLRDKGIIVISRCQFCANFETIDHLLVNCQLAWRVWSHFAGMFNIYINKQMTIKQLILFWMNSSRMVKHIRTVILPIILWAIWEGRNKSKHQGHVISVGSIIQRIIHMIKQLCEAKMISFEHWKGDITVLQDLNFEITVKSKRIPRLLKWHKPDLGFLKLNIDGSYVEKKDAAGGGCIIRNGEGNLVAASSHAYGNHSVLYAELRSLLDGLKLCCNLSLCNILVETDSMEVLMLIKGREQPPWHFQSLINSIKRLLKACNGSLSHIFREQNAAADFLAKYGATTANGVFDPHNTPPLLQAILDLEKLGIGYIRS